MRCLVRDGIPEEDVRTFAGRDAEGCPGAVVAEGRQSPAGAASSSPGSLVTADQLGHGPDDEPLAWFIEYAVAGEVKGAELDGERSLRAQPRHHRVKEAWPGRTDGSHRQLRGQHSNRKEARAKPATGRPACKSPHHTRHERSRRQEAVPV